MSPKSKWYGIEYPIGILAGFGMCGTLFFSGAIQDEHRAVEYRSSLQSIDAIVRSVRPFKVEEYHMGGLGVPSRTEYKPALLIDADHGQDHYKFLILGEHPLAAGDKVRFQIASKPLEPYGLEAQAAQRMKVDGFVDKYEIMNGF